MEQYNKEEARLYFSGATRRKPSLSDEYLDALNKRIQRADWSGWDTCTRCRAEAGTPCINRTFRKRLMYVQNPHPERELKPGFRTGGVS